MTAAYQATCDQPQCRRFSAGRAKPGWTLAASILASSLAFLDSSVMNVALPALKHDLAGTTTDLQWTINSYALPLSALILFGGAAGDRFGRRRFLIIGIVIFALASIGCALAPSFAHARADARAAGHRRGDADAEQPRLARRRLSRGDARPRDRHLGRFRRHRQRRGATARRLADRALRLARDLLPSTCRWRWRRSPSHAPASPSSPIPKARSTGAAPPSPRWRSACSPGR